jgi:hypothetical protein
MIDIQIWRVASIANDNTTRTIGGKRQCPQEKHVQVRRIAKWDRIVNTGGRKDRRPITRGKRVEKPEYRWRRTALLEPDKLGSF